MFSTNLAEKALESLMKNRTMMNSIENVRHCAQILPEGEQVDYLLQIPLTQLEKPILIESGYLKDTFYLAASEAQAQIIAQAGGVCYLPREIKTLLVNSAGMDGKGLKDYLGKIHAVKKTFEGTRIQ